ncbi:MAG: sulfite exporter TauE/SafE family protein [Myxococcales bacterium]|nr:sulfite exporter TauE/SafE family protein [Myxococcales bacterium]
MIFVLALIIFVAFAVQATAGFGSVLLSLSLGTLFWPLSELLPVVVPLSLMLSLYISSRHWRHANLRLLMRSIFPLVGCGVAIGFLLSPYASPATLRLLLGVVVCAAAARGLYSLSTGKVVVAKRGGIAAYFWVTLAGVVHGLIATGGPVLVYAIEAMGLGKSRFRASLAVVWAVLNGVLVTRFVATGALATPELRRILLMVPVLVVATLMGEILHSRVSESTFRVVVFTLLTIAGVLLTLPLLLG